MPNADPAVLPTRPQLSVPQLSVVVKCYNEEKNIGRCLESILAVTAQYDTEIIVADAKSADRTAAIASGYPVRVVQFENGADRNCGATAQLGWQFATGEHLLLVDGDMEVMPDFLPAAFAAFAADPTLGAVGGRLIEMSQSLEFQERLRRKRLEPARDGACVTGCGLYRAAAIRATGYFMDRNLHCYEEIDMGGRLRAAGWRLRLLDVDCVRHHGHTAVALRLLLRRWRSHTLDGYGEYLRAAWNTPRQREALWTCRFALVTIGWWAALILLALAAPWAPLLGLAGLLLALLPITALLLRKRRFDRAVYALAMWQLAGASLIRGFAARRVEPSTPFRAAILHEPSEETGR